MWRVTLVLMFSLTVLTACSEGDKMKVQEVLKHAAAVGEVANVVAQSDTVLASDVVSVGTGSTPTLIDVVCNPAANTCETSREPLFKSPLKVADLGERVARNLGGSEVADVREYKGIGLAEYRTSRTQGDVEWTTSHYGAWLDHSGLETTIASSTGGGGTSLFTAYSLSFGRRTDSAPTGDATWEGLMLGHTRPSEDKPFQGDVHPLQGDATLKFNLDAMTIDASFDEVKNMATAEDYSDISFSGVPVTDGTFAKTVTDGRIDGRFYGPAHDEVGGVFTSATALGAFGADRKQVQTADVVGGVAVVVAESNTFLASDVVSIGTDSVPTLIKVTCDPATDECKTGSKPLFEPPLKVLDLGERVARNLGESNVSVVRRHNGIGLAEYRAARTQNNAEWTTSHYGAWLDYNGFETTIANSTGAGDRSLYTAHSISFGKGTDSAPTGDATWEGLMLGHTRPSEGKPFQGEVEPIQGDALLNFKLDAATIDVFFTKVKNLATTKDYIAMRFSDIPVTNGTFAKTITDGGIDGRFYGPAHDEVGGVFTYPTAMGAFGARKQ